MVRFLWCPLLLASWAGCVSPPDFSIVPAIAFETVLPSQVESGIDSLEFHLSFTDGDGDIGHDDDEAVVNAFVVDHRGSTSFAYTFQLPRVESQGVSDAISGEIWLRLEPASLNCRPGQVRDTVRYEIYVVDRAGHESNRLWSAPVHIICN